MYGDDGSKISTFKKELWSYREVLFENPQAGNVRGYEQLRHEKKGYQWYMGFLVSTAPDKDEIAFNFIFKQVLQKAERAFPVIGLSSFEQDSLLYTQDIDGTFDSFSGPEYIREAGKLIYIGYLHGGTIRPFQFKK